MIFERLKPDDIANASQLVQHSFMDSVASSLTEEGIGTFQSGMTHEAFAERLKSGNIFLVCKIKDKIVGLGEVRNKNHLNLLFVDPLFQKKGIGRKLFLRLLALITEKEVTVNASINSVEKGMKARLQVFVFSLCYLN